MEAAIQIGSLLIIKTIASRGPVVKVRVLSQRELIYLESNQGLLSIPSEVLQRLTGAPPMGDNE